MAAFLISDWNIPEKYALKTFAEITKGQEQMTQLSMCFDTLTEAGRVQKNSTSLELLKAAAGYYSVTERI